jgi:hypothetical protein
LQLRNSFAKHLGIEVGGPDALFQIDITAIFDELYPFLEKLDPVERESETRRRTLEELESIPDIPDPRHISSKRSGSLRPTDNRRYYVYLENEVKGPYLYEQLVALYNTGTIKDDTRCCLEGTEEWRTYGGSFLP